MRVECTNCRKGGDVPPEYAGRTITCKACGMKFIAMEKADPNPPKPTAFILNATPPPRAMCPKCGFSAELPADFVGDSVTCPQCRNTFSTRPQSAHVADVRPVSVEGATIRVLLTLLKLFLLLVAVWIIVWILTFAFSAPGPSSR